MSPSWEVSRGLIGVKDSHVIGWSSEMTLCVFRYKDIDKKIKLVLTSILGIFGHLQCLTTLARESPNLLQCRPLSVCLEQYLTLVSMLDIRVYYFFI